MGDQHPAPWGYINLGDNEAIMADALGIRFGYDEAIDAHNALAAERDDLREALQHVFSLGSTCREVALCGCGSCQRARRTLLSVGFKIDTPGSLKPSCDGFRLDLARNKLRRAVEACEFWSRHDSFSLECDGDANCECKACTRFRDVLAENADIVAKIKAERGKGKQQKEG